MKLERYLAELKELEVRHAIEKSMLSKKYAFEDKKAVEGDIVEDKNGKKILVDKIRYCSPNYIYGFKTPQAVYVGVELTKKGEPNKRGIRSSIFDCDVVATEKK